MAKANPPKSGSAKIRFVMLEADIVDGDLDQITQAIQNAFRPNTVVQYKVAPQEKAALSAPILEQELPEADLVETNDDEGRTPSRANGSSPSRSSKPRKVKTPTVLELDLKSEPTWQDFAKEHDPQTDFDRFLTVALWLKEARSIAAVTADHVYTCYRAIGWSTSIADFAKPLRNLRDRQFMNTGPTPGEYAINHLGVDRVLKLKEK